MIPLFFLVLTIYFIVFCFFIYILICGNNKFHRDGYIGKLYYNLMVRFPNYMTKCCTNILPKRFRNSDSEDPVCMGKGGPCRYFICIFYMAIYAFFIFVYIKYVHPQVHRIYPNHTAVHRVLSFLVLPWPWVIFIAFQFMDPGEITPTNVLSYMKAYPCDGVIYKEGRVCPTLHIPVVARSRYCRYTRRRVACYDHYCPWVLASVGERTHRFFLLFLLSDIIASTYYAVGSFKFCSTLVSLVSPRIQWTQSKSQNAIFITIILFRGAPFVVSIFIILAVIAAALIAFFIQQLYYISINRTQVELDKYEEIAEERRAKNINEPIVNIYDHGFVQNWKEFLFPKKMEQHEPVYIESGSDGSDGPKPNNKTHETNTNNNKNKLKLNHRKKH